MQRTHLRKVDSNPSQQTVTQTSMMPGATKMRPFQRSSVKRLERDNGLPKSIPDLWCWLDGADTTTMWDSDTGGSRSALNGAVGRIEDKSGNNRHFVQSTSGSRPTRINVFSRPGLLFNGTSHCLIGPSGVPLANRTMFLVMQQLGSLVSDVGFFGIKQADNNDFSTSSGFVLQGHNTGRNDRFSINGASGQTYSLIVAGPGVIVPLTYISEVKTVTTGTLYANGFQVARDTSFTAFNSTATNECALGARYIHSGVPNLFSNIRVHEFILYSRALTEAERAKVEYYLNNKWSIHGAT